MAGHPPGQPLRAAQALQRDDSYVALMQRLERARRCYDAIAPLLPENLRAAVRTGALDGDSWSLLADSAAAAAKVRQMLPALQQHLRERQLFTGALRVKVTRRV